MNIQRQVFIAAFCLLFFMLGNGQAQGRRIYVAKASLAGSNADGKTWNTAYANLQVALMAAKRGDSIWVAQGVYIPGTDQNISFNVPGGTQLFGGFRGTERYLNERNGAFYQTILSGYISSTGNAQLQSFHVLTLSNIDSVTIDGIVIEGGRANVKVGEQAAAAGGGILIRNDQKAFKKIAIKNVVLRQNYADFGAAIAILDDASGMSNSLQIENCTFEKNVAEFGAALYTAIFNPLNKTTINHCNFTFNKASVFAALIFHSFSGAVEITQCTSSQNESFGTSLIRIENTNNPITIKDCKFNSEQMGGGAVIDIIALGDGSTVPQPIYLSGNEFSNIISREGGAISLEVNAADALNAYVKLNIEDCIIGKNVSNLGANGIKIVKDYPSSKIDCNINRCIFYENMISGRLFGVINFINYAGKGNEINANIINSLFYKNTGPVIYTTQYKNGEIQLKILNSTFFGNIQKDIVRELREGDGKIGIKLQNSIFYNQQILLSDILQNTSSTKLEGFSFNHCLFSALSCVPYGDTLGCGVSNIFGQYPQFEDSSNLKGLKLASGSIAINAGSWDPSLSALDLSQQPRVQDCKPDLGAYESASTLSPEDTLQVKIQVRSTPANMSIGEIAIQQISGGFPPYRIQWENGDSAKVRNQLAPGKYTLTIIDEMGCFKIYTYTVSLITSINEVKFSEKNLFFTPNPQNKNEKASLFYQNLSPGNWQVQLIDINGRTIFKQNYVLQVKGMLDFPQVGPLTAGTYIVILKKGPDLLSTKLMIN